MSLLPELPGICCAEDSWLAVNPFLSWNLVDWLRSAELTPLPPRLKVNWITLESWCDSFILAFLLKVERKLSLMEGVTAPTGAAAAGEGRAGHACYGCASACVEHCLTLLKALATKRAARAHLHQQGLVPELLNHNLRRGTAATRSSVQVTFLPWFPSLTKCIIAT
jgi:hypothetical protein